MFRKLSETFTATHFTILALGAMFVPGVLFGAVATSAVSITDPNTGEKSYIDGGRKLSVYDPIAGFQNNPSNYVRTSAICSNEALGVYTPPSGKAFVLKAVDWSLEVGTAGADNRSFLYINSGAARISELATPDSAASRSTEFGNGFFVKNGETIVEDCSAGQFNVTLTGYLVPSGVVPPASAVGQSVLAGRQAPVMRQPPSAYLPSRP